MSKKCVGCGIVLQDEDALKDGYVEDINYDLCRRCFMIKNYGHNDIVLKSNEKCAVTLEEYFQGSKVIGSSIRRDGLLIDDADDVLQQIFAGIPIQGITMTDYHDNIEYLS